MSIALPPGIYTITNGSGQTVVDADAEGGKLALSNESSGALNQQWIISGDGTIKSSSSDHHASATTGSSSTISRSKTDMPWTIQVQSTGSDNSFTGYITTTDGKNYHWAHDGNDISLQNKPTTTQWTFTSV
ncbi:hypothetical protein D9757_000944 [Collybiopsis confluens]|uniref:Ricin B lectin domain-containing protein n=1 Tax=Collybiopsis confluens TaxID=2823264 RepID=A0A8H5I0B4_9AGAR|nr:hypothetical protein D9757_000944 [Collybiopsis confluens]